MRLLRVAISIVTAVALAAATAGSASASSAGFHAAPVFGAGAALAPQQSTGNLYSRGGGVLTHPTAYIVFWGSEWVSGFSSGGYTSAQAQTYTIDFFRGLGGSSWLHSTSQYCQGVPSGTTTCPATSQAITNASGQLRATWVDGSRLPSIIDKNAVAAEATRAAQHFGYDPNGTYLVYTPSGHSMLGFGLLWCGWHESTPTSSGRVAYAYVPFQPDAGSFCGTNFVNKTNNEYGNGYFDGLSMISGHEYAETQTDPVPGSGWLDSAGAENADKCIWDGASTNVTLGSHDYAVQPLWSNASGGCAMTYQP
jgi:hypothetical protein